ncbi:UDP-N-acetylmuramoyl-L-alanine--D-glutamate ligase [Pasteurellaceae bacterium HPA106]|uniref:UDP-N-acetylmuramoyl-L-alanine--D-glutamate ligase n=1 Tax=Spirabiliibacterium pneumoniae TaxID=221400 RepID=UPI001AAD92E9|nr:UDP-N-acetylmuramoyl-L-alanine--D-glutamate ligase [Spirabiliibacterium pneumoniae]MBE2896704.1 UDP-N-acetylmuramoyl-L-alanine--D-glutamate ligase [Spirabiliibacterium pneumoniae]
MNYQGKTVCVVGLGQSGLSSIAYLIKCGATVRAIDTRTQEKCKGELPQGVETHFGSLNAQWLSACDLIVVSPGVALANPEIQNAIAAGVEVVGDIELFCRATTKPIIAITGSNGKSTVTTLVYEMAKAAGIKVGLGGNIGIPALSLLDNDAELFVLELSSFQLETTSSLRAVAATILNVSPDHLDRYNGSLTLYQQAKMRIYDGAQYKIFNAQDALTTPQSAVNAISFGVCDADYSLQTSDNRTWLCAHGVRVLACDELGIVGRHNELNALAALALTDAAGIAREGAISALKTFKGLDHRFQLVHQHNGVRWVNDSKATNIGSTQAALHGLQLDGTLHLLLGGLGKGQDFNELKSAVAPDFIQLYCFGQDGDLMTSLSPRTQRFDTMAQAIEAIRRVLKPGDMVLLSPACASFDQFNGFEHRGEVFKALAQKERA